MDTRGMLARLLGKPALTKSVNPVKSTLNTAGWHTSMNVGAHSQLNNMSKLKGYAGMYAEKGMNAITGSGAYQAAAGHLGRNKGKYMAAGGLGLAGAGYHGYNEMTRFSRPMRDTPLDDRMEYRRRMRRM